MTHTHAKDVATNLQLLAATMIESTEGREGFPDPSRTAFRIAIKHCVVGRRAEGDEGWMLQRIAVRTTNDERRRTTTNDDDNRRLKNCFVDFWKWKMAKKSKNRKIDESKNRRKLIDGRWPRTPDGVFVRCVVTTTTTNDDALSGSLPSFLPSFH